MNLPNKLTLLRLCLIPVFTAVFFVSALPYHYIISAVVFVLAAATDFLDGYIARKYNLVTDLGKFLDPIADKVIVVIMLFIFVGDGTLGGWYNAVIAGVIMSRELIITAFRIIAVQKHVVLAADNLGKIKTTFLDIGLIALTMASLQTGSIGGNPFFFFRWLGLITYYIGAFFAIVSGINYIVKNKRVFVSAPSDVPEKSIAETEKEKGVDEEITEEIK